MGIPIWLTNKSGRVYTVRSVALVKARNLVLGGAWTKPMSLEQGLMPYGTPLPIGDPGIYPEYYELNGYDDEDAEAAVALWRPLGDESVVPDGEDTEIDLALRPGDLSEPGLVDSIRVVVRDEGSGEFWSVPVVSRTVVVERGQHCDDFDWESDEWPLAVEATPVARRDGLVVAGVV
jgi:hypothetical protein